ncbi:MAG: RDD family protein [Candidatus Odinarchaeota archaeon]
MHCSNCGAKLTESDQFCYRCGAPITPTDAAAPKPAPAATQVPPPTTPAYPGEVFSYAGFWKRFAAWLLDGLILFAIGLAIGFAFDLVYFLTPIPFLWYVIISDFLLGIFTSLLYYSIFESSSHQATPGKMALGIIVTDIAGQRISFGRAVARDLSKIISVLTLGIGYLMIGFTDEKRGLHDYIAGTLVINK